MRQDQTILGHVLKYALVAMFFVVDEVVTWLFCLLDGKTFIFLL